MKHVNVYGPPASGKTRNAETLKRKYGCVAVVDEGKHPPFASLIGLARRHNGRVLILSQKPVLGDVQRVPVEEALA